MSNSRTCDWCHSPIEAGAPHVSLIGMSVGAVVRDAIGLLRDYHASSAQPCFVELRTAMDMAHDLKSLLIEQEA